MKRLLTAALLMATMVSVFAQDLAPPQQVKDLSWMVGTWSGTGKISFGGHEVEITSTMTISFDGQFLKAVSADKSEGSTLTKTTMTGWEPAKSQYISYTFTNMAPTARIALRMALPLWLLRLSITTTSPGRNVGTRNCSM